MMTVISSFTVHGSGVSSEVWQSQLEFFVLLYKKILYDKDLVWTKEHFILITSCKVYVYGIDMVIFCNVIRHFGITVCVIYGMYPGE